MYKGSELGINTKESMLDWSNVMVYKLIIKMVTFFLAGKLLQT